jgi:hypothetical protein
MNSRLTLREIEKRAWLRTFEPGMWDMALGSLFLSFGISVLVSFAAVSAIWIVVLLPAFREAGRKLIVPRIGHVQFRGRKRRANVRVIGMLAALAVLGGAVLAVNLWFALARNEAPGWVDWAARHALLVIGFIWGGAAVLTGWLIDFPRLYVYGALIFGSLWVSDFVPAYSLGISLIVAGGAILLVGVFLFIRFLRRYPRHDEPEPGAPE